MINQDKIIMESKYLIITALALLLVLPMASAGQGDLYKIYPDKVLINQEEVQDSDIWIDKYHTDNNGNKIYHIDSLRDLYTDENNESNNERVLLYLPYKVQPDWIKHINHKGEHVGTYFPTNENWEWEFECNEAEEDCSEKEGYVILRVDKIDEGLGSNTFPIGLTGPTWANDGQQFGEYDGVASQLEVENFGNELNLTTLNNNYSFSIWVKPQVIPASGTAQNIISIRYAILRGTGIQTERFNSTTPNIRFFTRNSTEAVPSVFVVNVLNEWIHVVGTWNSLGNNQTLYINGIVEDSDIGQVYSNETTEVEVGGNNILSGNTAFLEADLDEALIYNRTLSPTEVTALFNNYTVISSGVNRTGTPSTDGLVLDINFDDFSVADKSGEGNNGANTNVSFGTVFDINITLVEDTDYTVSTNLFTIINPSLAWTGISTTYSFIQLDNSGSGIQSTITAILTLPGLLALVVLIAMVGIILFLVFKFNGPNQA